MGFIKKALAAVPVALSAAAVAASFPTIRRYLGIRSHSRDKSERPTGVTTTPRSYITGRRP